MGMGSFLSATDISASGLAAERQRMEVVSNNIANAHSTRTPGGGPFRRQQVIFSAALDQTEGGTTTSELNGVQVIGVRDDQSELPRIHDPGHPDADDTGHVLLPNVKLPNEMVDLITASRSYEANLRALRLFQQMAEQTLSLLREA